MSYAAASCVYTVAPGKPHPGYPGGKYKVCVTPSQHRTMFGPSAPPAAPTPIGCGVFACAYPGATPDRVVKITRDSGDVSGLVRAQGSPFVPKVYSAFKLASYTRWAAPERRRVIDYSHYVPSDRRPAQVHAFGVVVERLQPLPKMYKKWLNNMGRTVRTDRGAYPEYLARSCPVKKNRAACVQAANTVADMFNNLENDYGITLDDLHYGNIGVDAKGQWKVLDMGQSPGTGSDPGVDELAGRRRRRR